MEELKEYIEKKLKELNRAIDSTTRKLEKEIKQEKIDEKKKELIWLDGCFEAYMKIYQKIKRV